MAKTAERKAGKQVTPHSFLLGVIYIRRILLEPQSFYGGPSKNLCFLIILGIVAVGETALLLLPMQAVRYRLNLGDDRAVPNIL